jgi:hypothetical protein
MCVTPNLNTGNQYLATLKPKNKNQLFQETRAKYFNFSKGTFVQSVETPCQKTVCLLSTSNHRVLPNYTVPHTGTVLRYLGAQFVDWTFITTILNRCSRKPSREARKLKITLSPNRDSTPRPPNPYSIAASGSSVVGDGRTILRHHNGP